MADEEEFPSEIREVPVEDIKPGPLQHKQGLTPVLEKIARTIYAKVGRFVYPSFEQWELGSIHPSLHRQHDPRPILAQADIILGQDVKTDEFFCLFGKDRLEDGGIPEGLKTLVIGLNPEDGKAAEMEKICAVIQMIRGRHDFS